MNLYLSKTHSDEDDDLPFEEGKLSMIYGSKTEMLEVCEFFKSVEKYLNKNENCHMHFRDYLTNWERDKNIDIEVNVEN